MQHQDWRAVTFDARRPAEARRAAPAVAPHVLVARRLDEETTALRHVTVGVDLKRELARARQAKGLTQSALAQQVGCDTKTIREYEVGRAIPNNAFVATLERALGTRLPRARKVRL